MNRDTILSVSDKNLNELCALRVMGWEARTNILEDTAYFDSDGRKEFDDCDYTPTKDITQAIALLEHLRSTRKWKYHIYGERMYVLVRINEDIDQASVTEQSLPRAICIAALLAVCAMEEA